MTAHFWRSWWASWLPGAWRCAAHWPRPCPRQRGHADETEKETR